MSINNLRDTIIPKSDQLNADELMGKPLTITVTKVTRGNTAEQPLVINYEDDKGHPYKPCKSMRRVIIFAWGDNGADWIGRSMTLYTDANVMWAGVKVGGIRISHMSDITQSISMAITASKGKRTPYIVEPLGIKKVSTRDVSAIKLILESDAKKGTEALKAAWNTISKEDKSALGGASFLDGLKAIAKKVDEDANHDEDGI